jgi:hypothetical protein
VRDKANESINHMHRSFNFKSENNKIEVKITQETHNPQYPRLNITPSAKGTILQGKIMLCTNLSPVQW